MDKMNSKIFLGVLMLVFGLMFVASVDAANITLISPGANSVNNTARAFMNFTFSYVAGVNGANIVNCSLYITNNTVLNTSYNLVNGTNSTLVTLTSSIAIAENTSHRWNITCVNDTVQDS